MGNRRKDQETREHEEGSTRSLGPRNIQRKAVKKVNTSVTPIVPMGKGHHPSILDLPDPSSTFPPDNLQSELLPYGYMEPSAVPDDDAGFYAQDNTYTDPREYGADGDPWEIHQGLFPDDPISFALSKQNLRRSNEENRKNYAKNWDKLFPVMVRTILSKSPQCNPSTCEACINPNSKGSILGPKKIAIWTVSLTGFKLQDFELCRCLKAPSLLLLQGWFPASPIKPFVVFSLDYLEFYDRIVTKGACSKSAFVEATRSMWSERDKVVLPDVLKQFYRAYAHWGEMVTRVDTRVDRQLQTELQTHQPSSSVQIFNRTALEQLCPACLYRTESPDTLLPLILTTDGNFQHRRLKTGTLKGKSYNNLTTPMFIPSAPGDYLKEWNEYSSEGTVGGGGCSNTFTAANKPATMRQYDETGLLNVCCRHGIPLRYKDMLVGERFGWVYDLVRRTLESVAWTSGDRTKVNLGLMYDIACKFQGFVERFDTDLFNATQFKVNAFHAHGHPISCQVINGPRNATNFGLTDGEGCERDWASKIHLVSSFRTAGSETRRQGLDRQSRRFARDKLDTLPAYIKTRWVRADNALQKASDALKIFFDKGECQFVDPRSVTQTIHCTKEVLKEQFSNQLDFFRYVQRGATKRPPGSKKIIAALLAEKKAKDLYDNNRNTGENNRLRNLKEKKTLAADALLKKYHHTRAQWVVGGTYWTRAVGPPKMELFKALQNEDRYMQKLFDYHRKEEPNSEFNPAGPNQEEFSELLRGDVVYNKYIKKTDHLLKKYKDSADDWFSDGGLYHKYLRWEVVVNLQDILTDILREVTVRAVELKSLHARVSGQAESKPLMGTLLNRYPKIENLISLYNKTVDNLPSSLKLINTKPLSMDLFKPLEEEPTHNETIRYIALLHLDALSCLIREDFPSDVVRVEDDDGSIQRNLTASGTWFGWGLSSEIRDAIVNFNRHERCMEENDMLKAESRRLAQWTISRIKIYITFLRADEEHDDNVQAWGLTAWSDQKRSITIATIQDEVRCLLFSDMKILSGIVKHISEDMLDDDLLREAKDLDFMCNRYISSGPSSEKPTKNTVVPIDGDGSTDEWYPWMGVYSGVTDEILAESVDTADIAAEAIVKTADNLVADLNQLRDTYFEETLAEVDEDGMDRSEVLRPMYKRPLASLRHDLPSPSGGPRDSDMSASMGLLSLSAPES